MSLIYGRLKVEIFVEGGIVLKKSVSERSEEIKTSHDIVFNYNIVYIDGYVGRSYSTDRAV